MTMAVTLVLQLLSIQYVYTLEILMIASQIHVGTVISSHHFAVVALQVMGQLVLKLGRLKMEQWFLFSALGLIAGVISVMFCYLTLEYVSFT